MKNDKLLDAFQDICRKEGSVCLVGPDSYSHFAELSDTEMETLLVDLTRANAPSINRMVFAESRTATDETLIAFMQRLLRLVFHGYVTINNDGNMGCFSPEGPPPTWEEKATLDRRIESALPLIPKAIIRAAKSPKRDNLAVSMNLLPLPKSPLK